MSEAILRQRYGNDFEVFSAGTEPKGIHPLTKQVLEEIGINTTELRSKPVKEYLGRLLVHYLVIVCKQAAAECPRIFPGMVDRVYWTFDDPPAFIGSDAEKLAEFRRVRDEIARTIDEWVANLPALKSQPPKQLPASS